MKHKNPIFLAFVAVLFLPQMANAQANASAVVPAAEDSVVVDSVAADTHRAVSGNMLDTSFEISGTVETAASAQSATPADFLDNLPEGFTPRTGDISNRKVVLVSGKNDFQASRILSAMRRQLEQCRQLEQTIDDVCLTDMGWWAVVHDDGRSVDGEIPTSCDAAIDSLTALGQRVVSLSIADDGNWALLTSETAMASLPLDQQTITQAEEQYGKATSVSITPKGCAVTCDRGILLRGVAEPAYRFLDGKPGIPTVVRVTDSGTCIAMDGKGFSVAKL